MIYVFHWIEYKDLRNLPDGTIRKFTMIKIGMKEKQIFMQICDTCRLFVVKNKQKLF